MHLIHQDKFLVGVKSFLVINLFLLENIQTGAAALIVMMMIMKMTHTNMCVTRCCTHSECYLASSWCVNSSLTSTFKPTLTV